MPEKQFLRTALYHYFETGNRFYQDKGRVVLVDLEKVTKYKALPEDPADYESTSTCRERLTSIIGKVHEIYWCFECRELFNMSRILTLEPSRGFCLFMVV